MTNTLTRSAAVLAAAALTVGGLALGATPAQAAEPLTNTAHLDFLLDTATPVPEPGHTTYRLDEEPNLVMPWTYADARDGGTFERVGGGRLDPATGDYEQGAFNTDDISRAAVVYLRHWQQTGSTESREKAFETLRALAYFQTTEGDDAGNVVLWMQTDGELNASAEPVELPDPSDSEDSYWLARTLWALGEGYAAFRDTNPEFAAFLQERLRLGVAAVDREVLTRYGEYAQADGVQVPAWLIVDGADATSEALLGLSAYLEAAPDDSAVRTSTAELAEGVAAYARTTTTEADTTAWPYGAILPWTKSRTLWHSWSSQMAGGLAASSAALDDSSLLEPALVDGARFAPELLTAGGPDNGWNPTPTDRVQIAYGADSRLQNSLALADATGSSAFTDLAAVQGAWFFGLNRSLGPVYDPATGVVFDGVQADGSVNRNSGAESTIHGLLAMLALDAHPDVADRARSVATERSRDGLTLVEAESARSGTVVTPESSWTGEAGWSGSYLSLTDPRRAISIPIGSSTQDRVVEAVIDQPQRGTERTPLSVWTSGKRPLDLLRSTVGSQGVTEAAGALLPQKLRRTVPAGSSSVEVRPLSGETRLDAMLVRPLVTRLVVGGEGGRTELIRNSTDGVRTTAIGVSGGSGTLRVYSQDGALVSETSPSGAVSVQLPAQGFAVLVG
ncbi:MULTISPECIES: hypothetical protein [unclassified Rathayibacter]|uniref:hypothetical protein n=2 Tax=Rathayibacter TaxID=33886 RepID=UPI000CE7CF91|nr:MULTISPECIES: hypothetical protein [unclassified Rathayibacter]PPI40771.1 hypothetical protein C5D50_04345 [Rathayibacter sp. RFBD1]PPI60772.1 hypothetical protein C5D38_04080 [Rathayibacter sp. TRS19]